MYQDENGKVAKTNDISWLQTYWLISYLQELVSKQFLQYECLNLIFQKQNVWKMKR